MGELGAEKWGVKYAHKADSFASTERWIREVRHAVQRLFSMGPSGAVLDLGCNTGRLIEHAKELRLSDQTTFVGVDVNVHGLDIAKARHPDCTFFTSTASLADESIDCAFCVHTINQIVDLDTVLTDLWRVMKRGGLVCIVTHNPWHYVLRPNRFGYKPDATIVREPTLGQLRQIMWDAGFMTEALEYFGKGWPKIRRERIMFYGRKPK